MSRIIVACCSIIIACVTGCGTASQLSNPGKSERPDFSDYNRVVVLDFSESIDTSGLDPAEKSIVERKLQEACVRIADQIALQLEENKVFEQVERKDSQGSGLLITGVITRMDEGNATLRMLIGFGAGSSYFDTDIYFSDVTTNEPLSMITVDRNSSALGGGIAASQTIDTYIDETAKHVTREIMKAKGMDVSKELTPKDAKGGARR